MKEGWEYKKLGEVGQIVTGSTPSTKDSENYATSDYCFFKPSDLPTDSIGYLSSSEYHISKKGFSISRRLPKGSVLVSCIGSIGKIGILELDATSNQQINSIIPNNNINSTFLALAILSIKEEMIAKANAPVVPIINKTVFSNFTILVPPLSEQQRIVEELDLLSSIIDKKKAQLKELDNLAQSIFYEMFGDPIENPKGWEVKKLKDVSLEKLSYGSGASAINYDGKVRYIRITDITANGELNNDIVSPSNYEEKYLLNDGDILFARSGATVGKTYCHKKKNGNCIYAGYLIRLIPNNEQVVPQYIFSYTKTSYYTSFIKAAQNAVAQPNINAKQYGNLLICIPPLPLQQQFASKIEAIERQKGLIKQSIKEVETLFNSRMDYYFN